MDKKQIFSFLILMAMLVVTLPAFAVTDSSTNLKVTLLHNTSDATSTGQGIPNASVGAKEVLSDGSYKWVASGKSDADGVLHLNLPKLGTGTKYILYTKQLSNIYSYSDFITTPGETNFVIGKSPVTVTAGGTNTPLTDVSITVLREKDDGSFGWFTRGNTDESGILYLDLPNTASGERYQFYTYSPWDNSKQYSPIIATNGALTFTVGNAPVKATVLNTHTGTPLVNLSITAYEILPTGKNSGSEVKKVIRQAKSPSI